jgi:hypothetical protein
MAKVPFSKLQAKVDGTVTQNFYHNLAGEEICYEVKHYLPFKEKLELISRIINNSIDDNGFYNPMRVKMYMALEVVYAYTNLSFTDKMKEDPFKLYDILISTDIFNDIINCICDKEWPEIQESVWDTIENIYNYRNSALGILEAVKEDYQGVSFDASEINKNISDPENLELLKQILSKLD